MSRILLLPHAPTSGLAHLGACLAVGGELRSRGHDVTVAYGGTRSDVIEREGFRWHRVPEVTAEREWDRRSWFSSSDELRSLVEARLDLLGRLRPDVAVSSVGIPGRLACERAGVPQLHLMHYLATSRYGRSAVVWDKRWRDVRRPRRLARVLRARLRSLNDRPAGPETLTVVNAVRDELGLGPAGPEAHAGARDSLVGLTTTPFLDPSRGLPERWRYIGPVIWSAPGDPDHAVPARGQRPLVYVTAGATGHPDLLRRAVRELASTELDVVVTTAGLCDPAELARLGPNVHAASLLPGSACLEAADAAVIHGGHLTFSQTLAAGTPSVVTPYRSDQIGRAYRVERLGVGIGIWPAPLMRGTIRRAVQRLLASPRYRQRAEEIADRLRDGWDGSRNAADLAERLAGVSGHDLGDHRASGPPRT